MEKAAGVQLFKVWGDMNDWEQLQVVLQLTKFEGQMTRIRFPANGSLYLTKSMAESDAYVALDREIGPSGEFCIGPSCERGWHAPDETATSRPHSSPGPCKYDLVSIMQWLILLYRARFVFLWNRSCRTRACFSWKAPVCWNIWRTTGIPR
jgi:hypothetical protein